LSIYLQHQFFKPNENIFKIGNYYSITTILDDKGDFFYIILKGRVKILKPIMTNAVKTVDEYFNYLIELKEKSEIHLLKKTIEANSSFFKVRLQDVKYLRRVIKTIRNQFESGERSVHSKNTKFFKRKTSEKFSKFTKIIVNNNTSSSYKENINTIYESGPDKVVPKNFDFSSNSQVNSQLHQSMNLITDLYGIENKIKKRSPIRLKVGNESNNGEENNINESDSKEKSDEKKGEDEAGKTENKKPKFFSRLSKALKDSKKNLIRMETKKRQNSFLNSLGSRHEIISPFKNVVNLDEYNYVLNKDPKNVKIFIHEQFATLGSGMVFGDVALEKQGLLRYNKNSYYI